ncbi:hypothetical protein CLAFUW4_14631 [Fulvia fulva]|uniref:Uncharacterized protein n=1 Tax=Passalora fulva TaxID=5499 RepID=A0A9Q8UWG3_PASFU|nr:uncharacterized protein CLAFUR5_14460 [Fulvia fulva]KAK4609078.1 hypothetical protein CLAFUR4_14625 [Fulvia fulva]KAK4609840.1 hypothetical protein CLAFUR0_14625 [Fulvia fulva]UJO24986.1 hypothetical protein CLAFUR5_14460 [Fulvia fulva]WPV22897.1 hypothetical protein CLAFUW4_14631 [Fulvia fulva]WPV37382.1 hypothetical protein CLAFUW7_14634 [Fulvia fulva]
MAVGHPRNVIYILTMHESGKLMDDEFKIIGVYRDEAAAEREGRRRARRGYDKECGYESPSGGMSYKNDESTMTTYDVQEHEIDATNVEADAESSVDSDGNSVSSER